MAAAVKTTKEERRRHVAQMNANFAIEGFKPDPEDKELQRKYVAGEVTLDDMLRHAREYALKAAQQGAAS